MFPCLNEAGSVRRCVLEAGEAIYGAGLSGEVIVVDNGSTDGSAALARDACAKVVEESAPGYGRAIQAGIRAATSDVVVIADADGSYDLSRIPALIAPIVGGEADVVIAERMCDSAHGAMPWLHRLGNPLLTFLVWLASGLDLRDSQSGFRALRRESLRSLQLASPGMEYASEMLVRASRAGLRVARIPTAYGTRIGTSKLRTFSDGWRHLRLLVTLSPRLGLIGGTIGILLSAVLPQPPTGRVTLVSLSILLGAAAIVATRRERATGTAIPAIRVGGAANVLPVQDRRRRAPSFAWRSLSAVGGIAVTAVIGLVVVLAAAGEGGIWTSQPAAAQFAYPPPASCSNAPVSYAGTHPIGSSFALGIGGFRPDTAVNLHVDGRDAGTKQADSTGCIIVTVRVLPGPAVAVDDTVLAHCWLNTLAARQPRKSRVRLFTIRCPLPRRT